MKVISKSVWSMVAGLLLSAAAHAYPAQFAGTWVNTNSSSSGIIRLIITPDLKLQIYQRCQPSPCYIGITQLWTYGKSVSDMNHKAATGHFGLSFKDIQVVLKLKNSRRIYMEHFNYFTDSSGRQNYWRGENFRKLSREEELQDLDNLVGEMRPE